MMKGREVKKTPKRRASMKRQRKETECVTRGNESHAEQDRKSEEERRRWLAAKCYEEGEKQKGYEGRAAGTEPVNTWMGEI